MSDFPLAWRMLGRDWKSGELRILVAALLIAVTAVTAVNLLTDRLGRLLLHETAEMLGGDLVLSSNRAFDPVINEMGSAQQLDFSEVVEFASIALHNDEILLTAVKAVSASYPLRGVLQVSGSVGGDVAASPRGPSAGFVWVDSRVLQQLGVALGEQLALGSTRLTVQKILHHEPDRGNNFFNLSPRILMSLADVGAANVIQQGSRVRYKYLFAGKNFQKLEIELAPYLRDGDRITTLNRAGNRSANTVTLAIRYVGFTALLTIVLAAIAIVMAARRYSARHFDVCAMLRCIGASQAQITRLYLWQLGGIILLAGLVGTLAGWLAHLLLLAVVGEILSVTLPAASMGPYLSGIGSALLLMMGFALPPVLRLRNVSPLRVFRHELNPMPVAAWFVQIVALMSLAALIPLLFGQMQRILYIVFAAVIVSALIGAGLYLLLGSMRRYLPLHGNLLLRSLRNLSGHRATSAGQILAFGLIMMIMATLLLLRTELIASWQAQLPNNVPNNFVYNLQPHELSRFKQRLATLDIHSPVYPVVRGRLLAINDARHAEQPNRELNLTWVDNYPADNRIVAGEWTPNSRRATVSVEVDLAKKLDIHVGDQIKFNSAGREIAATVTSLRSVDWQSFNPNFYIIFSAGALDALPTFYLTSFRLTPQQKSLLVELIREFPSITVIEIDVVIKQVQNILKQVMLMVELLLVFVLLAGFVVLLASIQANLHSRMREGGLLRVFGASKRYLNSATLMEFSLLGFVSGLLAVAGSQGATYALYEFVFDLNYAANYYHWLILPFASALLIGLVGYLSSYRMTQFSPRELLS